MTVTQPDAGNVAIGLDEYVADIPANVAELAEVSNVAELPADDSSPSTWKPQDIDEILDGEYVAPKTDLFYRADGLGLFYRGKTHMLVGASESGKTMVSVIPMIEELENGGRVAFIDHESDAGTVVGRLLAFGCNRELLRPSAGRFRYIRPDAPLSQRGMKFWPDEMVALRETIEWKPDLVVIDGVTEAMTEEGLDPISGQSNADFPTWLRLVARRFEIVGSCVVMIDHTGHDTGQVEKRNIGGQHKKSGITGASYIVETKTPFGQATTHEITGKVSLRLHKDRGGALRGRFMGQGKQPVVAEIELTCYPDGGITTKVVDPSDSAEQPIDDALTLEIALHLSQYEGSTGRSTAKGLGRNEGDKSVSAELKAMADRNELTITKVGNSHQHTLTEKGRALIEAPGDDTDAL